MLEWYATTSQVSWLFLLSAWVLALLVASFGYALWNRAGLRVHLDLGLTRPAPDSPVEQLPEHLMRSGPYPAPIFEGDAIDLEVGLQTTGASRGPVWVKGAAAGEDISLATGLVPKRGWRQAHSCRELRRGPLGATGWTIGAGDPLGFFQGTRRQADRELGLVLPKFKSLGTRLETRELEASVAAPRTGSGSEVFGIREYRPGDPLRRIHWRSSARHGELVVREFEPPGVRTLCIYLDGSPPSPWIADQLARIAASEAWDCIREGGRVVLWAPGIEPSKQPRDLWAQFEWLARYPSGDEGDVPRAGDEVVVVVAHADDAVLAAAAGFRHRRGWIVGDEAVEADFPLERVGTSWPL